MLVFFDRYTENVRKLRETMRHLGWDAQISVLQDDGFLPTGISSPYEFFVYQNRKEKLTEKDLFYNFIELPEFWEVRLNSWTTGGIFDMGCEKAKIYFKEPVENRNVHRVEWHMENGWVYKIDYYNKYGLKYASEFLDKDRNVESKVFYSDKNQEIVVEQPVNHMISLLQNGAVRNLFDSYAGFVDEYLKEVDEEKECILFVQDEKTFEILQLTSGEKDQWVHILFSNDDLWNKYLSMGGKNGSRFYAMPEEYPENHAKGEALILTASDRIESLEYLIDELPDMMFHIAAHTQVSDKLHHLAELENVKVYPQVSAQDLNMLWNSCDFYFDINYYREIYDAVDTAHSYNMLIIGFDHTAHHKELMSNECIFAEGESEQMAQRIKRLMENPALAQECLERQQQKKEEIWKGFYNLGKKGR